MRSEDKHEQKNIVVCSEDEGHGEDLWAQSQNETFAPFAKQVVKGTTKA